MFKSQKRITHMFDELEWPVGPGVDYLDNFDQIIGNRRVLGYLVQDDCPANPMTEYDYQGTLYTWDEGVITDDWAAVCRALGIEDKGYYFTRDLTCGGVEELAISKFKAELEKGDHFDDFLDLCREEFLPETDEEALDANLFVRKCLDEIDWDGLPGWLDTHFTALKEQAWDELFAQGKIGEYLAVPVDYCHSVHGPGTTRILTTTVDDCNAVWVPDKGCLENIFAPGATYDELYAAAVKYADSVLSEYEKWCNGEVYGVVVCTYTNTGTEEEPEWQLDADYDSCWGHIGSEWAEEALKDLFDHYVKKEIENGCSGSCVEAAGASSQDSRIDPRV